MSGEVNANLENERASSPVLAYIVDPTSLDYVHLLFLFYIIPNLGYIYQPFLYLSFIHYL